MGPSHATVTLRDLYGALFRHKKKALLVFTTILAGTTAWTVFGPKTYHSEGKLLVRLGRENVTLDATATLGQQAAVAVPTARDSEINSVVEVLRSYALAEKIVDAVGGDRILGRGDDDPAGAPGTDSAATIHGEMFRRVAAAKHVCGFWLQRLCGTREVPERELAIAKLSQSLTVLPVTRSNVIRLSCEAPSPELAQAVVTACIEQYRDEHLRLHRPPGAQEFFAEQAQLVRRQLGREEDELRQLKSATGLAFPERQREILVERVGRLEDELSRAQTARAVSRSKVERLRGQLRTLPATEVSSSVAGVGNDGTDDMRQQYYILRLQEQEAAAKYTEAHPSLQSLRAQVAEAGKILQSEPLTRTHVTTTPDKAFEDARVSMLKEEPSLASLEAEEASLHVQLAAARSDLGKFNEHQLRVARLEREIQLHDAEYRKYAANLEEARIDHALQTQKISNISVAQPASFNSRPFRPRVRVNLLLGLVAGLLGGLAVALGSEYLDQSLRSPEDVEARLELPVLASIPRLPRRQLAVNGRK